MKTSRYRNVSLGKTSRYRNVSWGKTHSWEWPKASHNIAEIYLPDSWTTDDINFKDISTACFIWENCKDAFNIQPLIIKRIRKFRNKYIAHNPSLRATEVEKAEVFDVLRDLLKQPDIGGHITLAECIDDLKKIEQGYQIEKWMAALQTILQMLVKNVGHIVASSVHLLTSVPLWIAYVVILLTISIMYREPPEVSKRG